MTIRRAGDVSPPVPLPAACEVIMPGIRKILLFILLLSMFAPAAQAQWATSEVEHDWTLRSGDRCYGLVQVIELPAGSRKTFVYFGQYAFTTSLRADVLSALLLAPLVTVGIATFAVCSPIRRNSG